MNKKDITALIFAYNDEKNIQDCIDSAKLLTNYIIIIDLQSSDHTVEIARKMGAVVFSYPHINYVEPAREFGIKKVNAGWIIILDADERLTLELAKEIET